MKISKIREAGYSLGRAGMAKLAKKYVEQCDGSYVGYMKLCGQLSVIAKMATCDIYWEEKTSDGIIAAEAEADRIIRSVGDGL